LKRISSRITESSGNDSSVGEVKNRRITVDTNISWLKSQGSGGKNTEHPNDRRNRHDSHDSKYSIYTEFKSDNTGSVLGKTFLN